MKFKRRTSNQSQLRTIGVGMRTAVRFHPGLQLIEIQRLFPNSRLKRSRGWTFTIPVVTSLGSVYLMDIVVSPHFVVRVYVRNHDFPEDTPHLYPDGSLCLYHSSQYEWNLSEPLSHRIIPWACLWLHCYDIWTTTSVWFGEEYPHQ